LAEIARLPELLRNAMTVAASGFIVGAGFYVLLEFILLWGQVP
jgi:hypothetical protein